MNEDCFGPVNWKRPKFGECLECFDTNWAHDHHVYFGGNQRMIGKICGHRFHPVKRRLPQFKINDKVLNGHSEP